MRNIIIVGAVLVAVGSQFGLLGGANEKPLAIPEAAPGKSATAPRPINENVVAYHTGDGSMNAAKKKARATLPRFVELVDANAPGTYTVKFPLTQNGETEHIWMQLTGHDSDGFTGLLANDPVNGNEFKMGDRVEVAMADVEDWMVRTDEVMYGGYTVRVMLKDMPKEQADKLRTMFRD